MAKKKAKWNSAAKRKKPSKRWRICEDCLVPLSDELLALAERFNAPSARAPTADDLRYFYRKFGVDLAVELLKFKRGVEYGEYFQKKLLSIKSRFAALEHKACLILNDDIGKDETIYVRDALRLLFGRHYDLLRKEIPDHDRHPERWELPEDLRNFEIEILDEYTNVKFQIRDTAKYLKQVAALVRGQMEKDKPREHLGRKPESKPRAANSPGGKSKKITRTSGRPREVDAKTLVEFVNKLTGEGKVWKQILAEWNKTHEKQYDKDKLSTFRGAYSEAVEYLDNHSE